MYYKLVDANTNKLVDVLDGIKYAKSIKNILRETNAPENAVGIFDSKMETVYCPVNNLIKVGKPDNRFCSVNVVAIDKNLYEVLKESLISNTLVESENTKEPINEDIEIVREHVIHKMNEACQAAIISGIDIGENHVDLTYADQINILSIAASVAIYPDKLQYPFHYKGQPERYFNLSELSMIINAANTWKDYHLSYFNSLKKYINNINSVTVLNSLKYGDEIPNQYQTETFKDIKLTIEV